MYFLKFRTFPIANIILLFTIFIILTIFLQTIKLMTIKLLLQLFVKKHRLTIILIVTHIKSGSLLLTIWMILSKWVLKRYISHIFHFLNNNFLHFIIELSFILICIAISIGIEIIRLTFLNKWFLFKFIRIAHTLSKCELLIYVILECRSQFLIIYLYRDLLLLHSWLCYFCSRQILLLWRMGWLDYSRWNKRRRDWVIRILVRVGLSIVRAWRSTCCHLGIG